MKIYKSKKQHRSAIAQVVLWTDWKLIRNAMECYKVTLYDTEETPRERSYRSLWSLW